MKKRIGILTGGGDCPGLNAAIRGVAKAAYESMEDVEIIGVQDGLLGLIEGQYRKMKPEEFSGILTKGGTILGVVRQSFKTISRVGEDKIDRVKLMMRNYEEMKLDCLVMLGGNGTHKTAGLLSEKGLNILGLPKTIDNDLYGTDVTFGFHSALDIATDIIDRIHTTADSHGRVMIVEIMGNKAGWLALNAGVAGGADVILLPEIPYDPKKVLKAIRRRAENGKDFTIIAMAEGAFTQEMAQLKKKERERLMAENPLTVSQILSAYIQKEGGVEARAVIPGHIQRGGSPSAYDRVLSTQFGIHAAELIRADKYGYSIALKDGRITHNPLSEIAGKSKLVPPDHPMVQAARAIGISFAD